MTAFECYKLFIALKTHFTSDHYDYFRFEGKTRSATEASFEKRKDKYFFKRLTNRVKDSDIPPYFVANFISGAKYISDMVKFDGQENYQHWKKRMESLHYRFSEDVDFILQQVNEFDQLFKLDGTHPPLLKYLLGKQISMETFVILDKILNFIPQFDEKITETIVWKDVRRTVIKYSPFVSVDTVKYKHTLKEKVLDHQCLSSIQK